MVQEQNMGFFVLVFVHVKSQISFLGKTKQQLLN